MTWYGKLAACSAYFSLVTALAGLVVANCFDGCPHFREAILLNPYTGKFVFRCAYYPHEIEAEIFRNDHKTGSPEQEASNHE